MSPLTTVPRLGRSVSDIPEQQPFERPNPEPGKSQSKSVESAGGTQVGRNAKAEHEGLEVRLEGLEVWLEDRGTEGRLREHPQRRQRQRRRQQ